MSETTRTLRRRSQRRIGVAPYFRAPARVYDLHTRAISTRQCFRVEFAATHSKQRIGAPAIRQFSEGSPAQTSVKPCQLFLLVSHSKQTIETQIKCQFFAMSPNHLFRVSNFAWSTTSKAAGLKYPALRLVLRRANGRVLPTGLAVDYDSARSAAEGGLFGRVKKNDRRSPGPAKVPANEVRRASIPRCGSSPSTGRRYRNDGARTPMSTTRTNSDRLN